jgi:hypothetical protein
LVGGASRSLAALQNEICIGGTAALESDDRCDRGHAGNGFGCHLIARGFGARPANGGRAVMTQRRLADRARASIELVKRWRKLMEINTHIVPRPKDMLPT